MLAQTWLPTFWTETLLHGNLVSLNLVMVTKHNPNEVLFAYGPLSEKGITSVGSSTLGKYAPNNRHTGPFPILVTPGAFTVKWFHLFNFISFIHQQLISWVDLCKLDPLGRFFTVCTANPSMTFE